MSDDLVDILRADRDSAARMWQASEQEREAAVDRAREASQYLAIETQHAAQAEARAEAAEAERDRLRSALKKIVELDDRPECCGNGISDGFGPPECCGRPTYGLDRAQKIAFEALQQDKPETP